MKILDENEILLGQLIIINEIPGVYFCDKKSELAIGSLGCLFQALLISLTSNYWK